MKAEPPVDISIFQLTCKLKIVPFVNPLVRVHISEGRLSWYIISSTLTITI